MNADQLSALLAAAGEGVAFDGLHAGRDDDGYRFETPSESRTGLSEASFREACEENPWFVSNWFYWTHYDRADHERAFLRWLERAPPLDDLVAAHAPGVDEVRDVPERYEALTAGVERTWGQVLVTAELGDDGHRRYHVRHEADAGVELARLEVHADPLEARRLVKYDDRGRYRPLKTAPSLPTGWAFTDLSGRELARTVDLVYPATVANWHLERRGELDVNHYRETAERQTGIYDVVDELDVAAVEWMAEACCVDSQCLKRREWDEDPETELGVPRGEGVFPCREPCSLVIAAARKWTKLEQEAPRAYTFELTPSEKEQLEALIEAVAEDRVDQIREADVSEGANRYRTRFLRAKRLDEDGNLAGVPTHPEKEGNHDGDDH